MARINFDCLEPLRVRQWVIEDIGIRDEPCVAVTEILFGFAGQTAIGCPTVAQLTLFPSGYSRQETSSWEQRKLGELLLERNEQAPQSDQYPLMAFIANQGIAPKGDRYDRSALVNDIEGKLYKRTEKGDFIYSSNNLETGSIGLNKYGNACISPVYCIFQPSGIADSDFLGRRLVRKDFIQEMVKWRQGVIYGQWRIHEADFLRLNIAVPSVDEQRLIGKLLDNLDALITLHQREPRFADTG